MSKMGIYLIIGATTGYGKAIAEQLSQNSENRVITAQRSPISGGFVHDVGVPKSWQNLEEYINAQCAQYQMQLAAIVYASGIAADIKPIGEKSTSKAIGVLHTNVDGLYYALDMSTRLLKYGGVFVNIGSIAYRKNYFGGSEYCASKAAQTTLIRTARIEGLAKGVRYCTLNPGLGDTNFQKNRFDGDQERADRVVEGLRILDACDVAHAVNFMLNVPNHVCISELEITPTQQAEHGEDLRKYQK